MTTAIDTAPPGTAHGFEPTDGPLLPEELELAYRNPAMPLDALRYDMTPIGLHYQLVHFDIPAIDTDAWRLQIGGAVRRPVSLTIDDIRARPARTLPVTLECAGNGRGLLRPRPVSVPWLGGAIGTASWTGTPLAPLLREAGVADSVVELVFTGADRGIQGDEEQDYARSLTLAEAMRPEILLAYTMNGQPLPPQHGFPLRLLVPGWYGMTSVKWLTAVSAVTEPFAGFQQKEAYHFQRDGDDPGEPVNRIRVRALMIPPGIPDFATRHRIIDRGRVPLRGRAWCGDAAIARVEVAVDGGAWKAARLGARLGPFAWRAWSFEWDAMPGEHELTCRATDAHGRTQPLDPPWNYQGMGNNAVQRVAVTVR